MAPDMRLARGPRPPDQIQISRGFLGVIAGAVLGVFLIRALFPLILLVVSALILAVGLLPVVDGLVRRGLPRRLAVSLLALSLIAAIFAVVDVATPPLLHQVRDVQTNFPESAQHLEDIAGTLGIHVNLQERARQINWNQIVAGKIYDYAPRLLPLFGGVFLAVVLAFDFLFDLPDLLALAQPFVSERRRDDIRQLSLEIQNVMAGYLRGQLLTSLMIGFYTTFVLVVVGVHDSVGYGTLAAFADVVPEVGAVVAVVTTTAAGLQQSGTQALIVLVCLLAYHQFEGRYLVPRVFGKTLNLPPIAILIAALSGGYALGIVGVLIALPLAAAIRVVFDFAQEKRMLGNALATTGTGAADSTLL